MDGVTYVDGVQRYFRNRPLDRVGDQNIAWRIAERHNFQRCLDHWGEADEDVFCRWRLRELGLGRSRSPRRDSGTASSSTGPRDATETHQGVILRSAVPIAGSSGVPAVAASSGVLPLAAYAGAPEASSVPPTKLSSVPQTESQTKATRSKFGPKCKETGSKRRRPLPQPPAPPPPASPPSAPKQSPTPEPPGKPQPGAPPPSPSGSCTGSSGVSGVPDVRADEAQSEMAQDNAVGARRLSCAASMWFQIVWSWGISLCQAAETGRSRLPPEGAWQSPVCASLNLRNKMVCTVRGLSLIHI